MVDLNQLLLINAILNRGLQYICIVGHVKTKSLDLEFNKVFFISKKNFLVVAISVKH